MKLEIRILGAVFLFCAASPAISQVGRCEPIPPEVKAAAVGKSLTPDIQQQLLTVSGASAFRVLRKNDAATMEARENRLNIQLDEQDRILSIWCDLTTKTPR